MIENIDIKKRNRRRLVLALWTIAVIILYIIT